MRPSTVEDTTEPLDGTRSLAPADAELTSTLLERAGHGDRTAIEQLFARYLPRMRRWASGRLPSSARDLSDTHDLVQETLLRTFTRVGAFEWRGEGAFHAYLRQAILNQIRNELRRFGRRPDAIELDSAHPDDRPSPLEQAVGREAVERYESSLADLKADERDLVIARVELGYDYDEIARAFGRPTPEAARKAVRRAMVRLLDAMKRRDPGV